MPKRPTKKPTKVKKAPKLALPKGAIVVWADPTARGGIKSKPVVTEVGTKLCKKLSAAGWPIYGIANVLGIEISVFQDVRKRQPEVQASIDAGRSTLQAELVYHLLEAARGGAFVPAMFLLKSLCGVREAGPTDGGQGAGVSINISIPEGMSSREFEKMIDITPPKEAEPQAPALPAPSRGVTR